MNFITRRLGIRMGWAVSSLAILLACCGGQEQPTCDQVCKRAQKCFPDFSEDLCRYCPDVKKATRDSWWNWLYSCIDVNDCGDTVCPDAVYDYPTSTSYETSICEAICQRRHECFPDRGCDVNYCAQVLVHYTREVIEEFRGCLGEDCAAVDWTDMNCFVQVLRSHHFDAFGPISEPGF